MITYANLAPRNQISHVGSTISELSNDSAAVAPILGWHVFRCRCAVCHAAVACSAVGVWGLDSSCVEQSVGDSLSVATAPGSV